MFKSHLAYLTTTLLFAGSIIVVDWLLAGKTLKKYKAHIGIVAALSFVWAFSETPALWLKAWTYNADRVIHFKLLGTQVETFVFAVSTCLAVAFATLVFASIEDNKRSR